MEKEAIPRYVEIRGRSNSGEKAVGASEKPLKPVKAIRLGGNGSGRGKSHRP
jgi:hypothetical protein